MKKRNLLLASTALALLATAPSAQAGLYFSGLGGVNWLEDSSGFGSDTFFCGKLSTCTASFGTDADTGFIVGGAIGMHLDNWVRGLRTEIEASYRRQDVGGHWYAAIYDGGGDPFDSTSGAIDANESKFAIMVNVWYDIDAGWPVRPYVGGGVGWARASADGAARWFDGDGFTEVFNRHDNGFAWQLGGGFLYEVQPGVDVGFGYRYFQGPDVELFFDGKLYPITNAEIENNNHTLVVNLIIDIN